MKTSTMVWLVILVILAISISSIFGYVVNFNNQCVKSEQALQAQYSDNQNSYDAMFKKIKETAQVPDKYVAGLKTVYDTAMKGRYGDEGSHAVMQWITEQNPNLDASVYKQIQQVIEASRNDFKANQTTLLDKKRIYQTLLNEWPGSILAGILHYPKLDLKSIDIVTSDITEQAFATKKANAIQI
jgi:hypothetical protein